ncbi:hypothetical protein A3709_19220 [Halioglobus sp. HI00S01]|uniref:DNA cytosine methyltransferase n=1 Tax=Halioglobus sp. HI00S01 TaxID=1822214 RepID=UPI0007C2506E|nr:DNA cytosine methyltransferase [Halioglobus sp. HI00S01]KZX57755.1 hypothetical protein A3709_19220 [Halioglobus sp. HI00S01]
MQTLTEFEHKPLSAKLAGALDTLNAVTKVLKIQNVGKASDKRKLVISTNWLNLFGFAPGSPVEESVIGQQQGMTVSLAKSDEGKRVYSRGYANRERETLMDIRHQSKLKDAFGSARCVHITFRQGELTIVPIDPLSSRASAEGVNVAITDANGLYGAIFDVVALVKEHAFSTVTVDAEGDFDNSQEAVLLAMQLRRLGYALSKDDQGRMKASLSEEPVPMRDVDLRVTTPHNGEGVAFNAQSPLSTFAACTSGVDITGLEQDGFAVSSILEWRPPESRDFKKDRETGEVIAHNDKTESGAICAALNAAGASAVFNEDIYQFSAERVKALLANETHFSISLQCDCFSSLKNKKDRQKAIDSLDSTRDMIFPALEIVEQTRIPSLCVENVASFAQSVEHDLFVARLEQLGYQVYSAVLNAGDFDGYTKRNRCFVFATLLDTPFAFPEPVARTTHLWNDIIAPNLEQLRDVTHCKSVHKGVETGRIRLIREGDATGPTLTKNQPRQTKDSVYCQIGDRYYLPSVPMMMQMMAMPSTFDLSAVNQELASEIIGQSVCLKLHSALYGAIKKHLTDYAQGVRGFVKEVVTAPLKAANDMIKPMEEQMALF